MREQTIHLHLDAPAKPAEGEACNGCGVCCALETCPAARLRFLKSRGPCPALTWSDHEKRYHCGLLLDPRKYVPIVPASLEFRAKQLLARWIAAGKGCDCDADVQT